MGFPDLRFDGTNTGTLNAIALTSHLTGPTRMPNAVPEETRCSFNSLMVPVSVRFCAGFSCRALPGTKFLKATKARKVLKARITSQKYRNTFFSCRLPFLPNSSFSCTGYCWYTRASLVSFPTFPSLLKIFVSPCPETWGSTEMQFDLSKLISKHFDVRPIAASGIGNDIPCACT